MPYSPMPQERRLTLVIALTLFLVWLGIYFSTMYPSVSFVDSGELSMALNEPGIAHPPGYPLYTLLGFLFTRLPLGEVAWRVNLFSALWGAAGVGIFFLLVVACARYLEWKRQADLPKPPQLRTTRKRGQRGREAEAPEPEQTARSLWRPDPPYWLEVGCGLGGATLLAASATFWSRTSQAKMYSLHYALVALVFLAALNARWAWEREEKRVMRRWLVALSLGLGLALTNHLTTILTLPGVVVLLLAGRDPVSRARGVLGAWAWVLPALLLPLLLYVYLPLRSAQDPLMNWGSPDTLGDFWRHVSGWQYRVNFNLDLSEGLGRISGYIGEQWLFLSWVVAALGVAAVALLWRRSWPLATSVIVTMVVVTLFSMAYGVSETDAYMVPAYMVLTLAFGLAPLSLSENSQFRIQGSKFRIQVGAVGALVVLGLALLVLQYPHQNHSKDRLAEQFVANVFAELPPNSVLLTDYWDFYSPTIYLQNLKGARPDVAIINITSMRYPYYAGYLEKYRPDIVASSRDVIDMFRAEQRKWVNGEQYSPELLSSRFFAVLDSFVSRHIATRPVFTLWQPCGSEGCESAQVALRYFRQPAGLTTRLLERPSDGQSLPAEPQFRLDGLLDRSLPLDAFSRLNSKFYLSAYGALGELYRAAGRRDAAERMNAQYFALERALDGR